MKTRWPHILGGVVALGLGTYGLYDEYFTFVEFFKGAVQPVLSFVGLIAILAGILSAKPRIGHVVLGLILLGVSIYGFFDEYYATLDFFKGSVPVALLVAGTVSVVAGVKLLGGGQLNAQGKAEDQG
jgi:hypothetical protein